MFLISIFSVQIASSSDFNSQQNSDNFNKDYEFKENSKQKIKLLSSSNSENYLRNLSMSDLFNYIRSSYSSNSFQDSKQNQLDTTITVSRGLAILKMIGLTGYAIPLGNGTSIYSDFSPISANGGFSIHSSISESSVMGTYGVLLSSQLLNLAVKLTQIQDQVTNYLLSKYSTFSTGSGFKEDYQTVLNGSILTTYYGVQSLSILNYKFSQDQIDQISEFLLSMWDNNSFFFRNENDKEQSEILTSFQAISILNTLNKSGNIDSNLWLNIKNGFPSYINSNQESSGVFNGGIHSNSINANVDDTGSAISALYILDKTQEINLTSAIDFILQSQYLGSIFSDDKGGFSSNNATHSETSQNSDVKLRHTYYAILGLYASGYLTNHTDISLQTQFSKENNVNDLENEIIVGQNTSLSMNLNVMNFKNIYQETNIDLDVNQLESSYLTTDNTNEVIGSEFKFVIKNTTQSNFYLGKHSVKTTYSLTNFSIIPVKINTYESEINVRFPITSKINDISSSLEVNPGDLLTGEIIFDNNTVNSTQISYNTLGNLSINLVFPNSTNLILNSSNDFPLLMTNKNYLFNYTFPMDAVLGDYVINITYNNGTGTLFYTQQMIKVTTELFIKAIISNSNNFIYPGSSYGLNFTIIYENGYINPGISLIKAKFLESTSNLEKFSTTLEYISGDIFQINTSDLVPIGLFTGSYNISLEFSWYSNTTKSTLLRNRLNSTLQLIQYEGTPILLNQKFSPLTQRGNNNILYSGDFINLTADIGIKNNKDSIIYLLNETVDVSAFLFNTSKSDQTIQILTFKHLNNSTISIFGEINPNINHKDSVNISLDVKIKYKSTNEYKVIYNENGSEFKPTFLLEKANIEIEQSSVNFLIGSANITKNSFSTLLVTFKVKSSENQEYVTGLRLGSSIRIPKMGDVNETDIILPSITSLDSNKSYQLQIPLNALDVGIYTIKIATLDTNVSLGSIAIEILPAEAAPSIPIENFIAVGTISIALIVSYIAYSTNKRK
jgi:hypothetical protein